MNRRAFVCVLGVYLFFIGANPMVAVSADNPYLKIVDRNIFGLKPPPAPPSPESLRPPPPKITLTGITTLLGIKRVLMRVPMPARPPEPAKEESLMMTEGQRDGEIEVVEIDEKAGTVKVRNYGTEMTLNLEKDGAKPLSMPIATLPGTIPTLNNTIPAPRTIPTTMPSRTLRVPQQMNPSGVSNPTPAGGTASAAGTTPKQGADFGLSPEEQTILIEVEREQTRHLVQSGDMPPLPATEITPEGSHGVEKPLPPPY